MLKEIVQHVAIKVADEVIERSAPKVEQWLEGRRKKSKKRSKKDK